MDSELDGSVHSAPAFTASAWAIRTPRRRDAKARAIITQQCLADHESRLNQLEAAFQMVATELKNRSPQDAYCGREAPPGLEGLAGDGKKAAAPASEREEREPDAEISPPRPKLGDDQRTNENPMKLLFEDVPQVQHSQNTQSVQNSGVILAQVSALQESLAEKNCLLELAHEKLDAAKHEAHGAKAELAMVSEALAQSKVCAAEARELRAAGDKELTKLRGLLKASRAEQLHCNTPKGCSDIHKERKGGNGKGATNSKALDLDDSSDGDSGNDTRCNEAKTSRAEDAKSTSDNMAALAADKSGNRRVTFAARPTGALTSAGVASPAAQRPSRALELGKKEIAATGSSGALQGTSFGIDTDVGWAQPVDSGDLFQGYYEKIQAACADFQQVGDTAGFDDALYLLLVNIEEDLQQGAKRDNLASKVREMLELINSHNEAKENA